MLLRRERLLLLRSLGEKDDVRVRPEDGRSTVGRKAIQESLGELAAARMMDAVKAYLLPIS